MKLFISNTMKTSEKQEENVKQTCYGTRESHSLGVTGIKLGNILSLVVRW